ncbi:MAG TPA: hypothetical protein VIH76_06060 [Candidatus Acidoferrales bacterium]
MRDSPHPRLLERLFFGVATLLIGVSSAIRTWARACPEPASVGRESAEFREERRDGPYRYLSYPMEIGNLIYSIGLGFLAPALGFVLLVMAESVVCFRLIRRERELRHAESSQRFGPNSTSSWGKEGVPGGIGEVGAFCNDDRFYFAA